MRPYLPSPVAPSTPAAAAPASPSSITVAEALASSALPPVFAAAAARRCCSSSTAFAASKSALITCAVSADDCIVLTMTPRGPVLAQPAVYSRAAETPSGSTSSDSTRPCRFGTTAARSSKGAPRTGCVLYPMDVSTASAGMSTSRPSRSVKTTPPHFFLLIGLGVIILGVRLYVKTTLRRARFGFGAGCAVGSFLGLKLGVRRSWCAWSTMPPFRKIEKLPRMSFGLAAGDFSASGMGSAASAAARRSAALDAQYLCISSSCRFLPRTSLLRSTAASRSKSSTSTAQWLLVVASSRNSFVVNAECSTPRRPTTMISSTTEFMSARTAKQFMSVGQKCL
mmetsp:Transcript_44434/g.137150  ORF Transcript_44434/g.137150 Transcript_44434/m.137150 type:complete len:339 (-) Transcript_44434:461-1477(-)